MSIARESAKVTNICALLRARGAWYVKTTGVALAGCPDLLVCYRGHFLALEVKREHNGAYGVTKKQSLELAKVERAEGISAVVVSKEDVTCILNVVDCLVTG